MEKDLLEKGIQKELSTEKAVEVADLFLSPFIDEKLFLVCLMEEGPPLWVVNRSDVYNETLKMLSHHSDENISRRSKEKIMLRLKRLFH